MTNYAIVGDGATGTTAAFYLRRGDPDGLIRIYSDDPTAAYYRAALTNYLMGELRADQLFAVPPNFYEEFKVERVLTRVNGVDPKDQRLDLANGQRPGYDQLLVAAGARATMPSFPGVELSGIMTMRTMQDARVVMDQIAAGRLKRAVVVGGGILGLELVAGLTTRGVAVTWIVRGDSVVSPPLDRAGSDLVLGRCRHFGVDLRLNEEVGEVAGDKNGRFRALHLKGSGATVEAQLLAMSIGITPNIEFLDGSGIKTNRGVVVDDHLRSNLDNVYAGGDIAEVPDPFGGRPRVIGLWEPARYHGRVAGINMTGGSETWVMDVPYTATRLYDLDVGAVGQSIEEPTDDVVLDFPRATGTVAYRKLVFRDSRLAGALLLGHRKEKVRDRAKLYRKLVASKSDVSEIRDRLLDPFFDLSGWLESRQVETDAPRALATIAGPAVRTSMSTMLGKLPGPSPRPPAGARQTLSSLMRPAEGLSGTLAPVAEPRPPVVSEEPKPEANGKPPAAPASLRMEDGRVIALGDSVTIGRSRENNLVIEDDTVSGKHAEIARQGPTFVISDLGSRNGTFIEEAPVAAPQTLRHGQAIRLGNARLTFIQQVLPPRPTTGPAGLPSEPLEAAPDESKRTLGRLEFDGRRSEITLRETSVGRDPAGDITVDEPAVSWLHAQITRQGDALYLRDLGSRNGTFVSGELVSVPRRLADGDVIHLGNTDLVFRSDVAPVSQRTQMIARDAVPPMDTPRLVGNTGSALGMSFALTRPSLVLGRDPSADISVKDLTVSRSHARFQGRGSEWTVTDLRSTNGTLVGGRKLSPNTSTPLGPGEEIKVGEVAFVFEVPQVAVTPQTEPGVEVASAAREAEPASQPPRGTVRVVLALAISAGPKAGERIPLASPPVTVGREGAPGVFPLDDHFVSGRHAEFDRAPDGTLTIKDLGSTNGTKVNGRSLPAQKPRRLKAGDKIQLGPETQIVVEMETT